MTTIEDFVFAAVGAVLLMGLGIGAVFLPAPLGGLCGALLFPSIFGVVIVGIRLDERRQWRVERQWRVLETQRKAGWVVGENPRIGAKNEQAKSRLQHNRD